MVLLSKSNALTRTIETDVRHAAGDPMVRADEEQLRQVFLNLAINACEAMPHEGKLFIKTVGLNDQWLKVAFQDEGAGISDEARSRLFEPFFTTKQGGTGLGLAIANKIVEAHGGKIEVRNLERKGAEFAIVLPLTSLPTRNSELEQTSSVGSTRTAH